MYYYISVIGSFLVAVAAIIGWIRFSKIGPAFFPFIILVTLATVNELISFIAIRLGHSNAVNANVYSLIESMLILWQFRRWGLFYNKSWLFYFFIFLFAATWIVENLFVSSLTQFSSYFNILYGFSIVMMSISMINRLLLTNESLLKNAIFLICCCFSLFFTYSALVEIYWVWGLDGSKIFRRNIYRILYFINLLVNLTYTLAILWIPKKQEFIRLC